MGLFDNCNPDISIICIWPEYPIEIGGGSSAGDDDLDGSMDSTDEEGDFHLSFLGHAGILLIKGGTGPAEAHYYEYGRYRVAGGNPAGQGNVRDYAVDTIILDDSGWPTSDSLHQTVKTMTQRSGRNTKFHGNVDHLCGEDAFNKAQTFAENFKNDPNQHYNLFTNSCMTFSFKVNKAGGWDWFGSIPVWNSRPAGQLDDGFFSNHVTYDPDGDDFNENVWQISGW